MNQKAAISQAHSKTSPDRNPAPGSSARPSNGSSSGQSLLQLQEAIGNRATRDVLDSGLVQPKLRVGPPGDRFEREADHMADAVMRMPAPDGSTETRDLSRAPASQTQRMCAECAEEEEKARRQPIEKEEEILQPKAAPGGAGSQPASGTESRIESLRGGGQSLSPAARSFFEPRFGHDFSDVRVHTGNSAAETSRSISARAFTVGRDVVFGSGEYSPESRSGRRLLAHELSHVVQQQSMHARGVLQRKRDPDIVHKGYSTFYLKTGGKARELAVQFYYSGSGTSVTVKIAHLPTTPNMRQATLQLSSGATFKPTILIEAQGVATFDLDGDGKEDMQVLTSVENYSLRLPTTSSSPSSVSSQTYKVRDVYALAQFGSTNLVVEAPGQGLSEEAIWAPRWRMASHPHPNIGMVWKDTKKSRYQIPPPGASMGSLHPPPSFIRSRLPIASRAVWNARAPITNDPKRSYETYTKPLKSIYNSIVVHHAGNEGYRSMSEVQDLHMDKKERADIGYHFGIGLSGRVYTGRPLKVKGAHVAGANTGKIGIVLLADLDAEDKGVLIDFSDDSFTDRMQASLIRLIERLQSQFPGILYLGGHKEFDSKRHCPGNLTMNRMATLRSVTNLQAPP